MADYASHPYAKTIWDFLISKIGNEYGVAGLMGNLAHESGLYPDRVQGDIPYSNYSKQYTAKVDSGEISEYDFVHNGPNGGGYGLAQWTYPPRKQGLYDMKESLLGNKSIGDINVALRWLWVELQNDYSSVLKVLKSASDIRTPSDKVLHDFENPLDQSTAVEVQRYNTSVQIFNTFSGSEPLPELPDEPENPEKPVKSHRLSLLMMYLATKRKFH